LSPNIFYHGVMVMFSPLFIFILLVFILLAFSVRERIKNLTLKERAWDGSETKSSPLSSALSELIGTAGGIYLCLVMLFSFLELQLPSKIHLLHMELEPLATVSFTLAIIQPYIVKLIALRKRF